MLPNWALAGSNLGGRPVLSSFIPLEALHLWLPQPGAVESAAGTRGGAQRRGDVAAWSVSAGPQDDCGLPQGQRRSHQEGLCALRRAVPADGLALESERCDRWQQVQSKQPRQEFPWCQCTTMVWLRELSGDRPCPRKPRWFAPSRVSNPPSLMGRT